MVCHRTMNNIDTWVSCIKVFNRMCEIRIEVCWLIDWQLFDCLSLKDLSITLIIQPSPAVPVPTPRETIVLIDWLIHFWIDSVRSNGNCRGTTAPGHAFLFLFFLAHKKDLLIFLNLLIMLWTKTMNVILCLND